MTCYNHSFLNMQSITFLSVNQSFSIKVPERYEKCFQASPSLKEKSLPTRPSRRERATLLHNVKMTEAKVVRKRRKTQFLDDSNIQNLGSHLLPDIRIYIQRLTCCLTPELELRSTCCPIFMFTIKAYLLPYINIKPLSRESCIL